MKKLLLTCLSLLVSALLIVSAQDASLQGMIPPSPEAAPFAKAANYDVGPFTGKPDIQVPIYTIKTRSLSVPISLSYDATGIRVDNIASWVGMNWSMAAGGLITRSVMDLPDEGIGGYLNGPPPRTYTLTNTQTWVNYFLDKLVTQVTGNKHDLKPDRFSYSFNGRSGSFQFKNDLSIMQIPQTSLQISVQFLAGGHISFHIVDETGTTYVFTTLEQSQIYTIDGRTNTGNALDLTTAWYLTQIISADGHDQITFNYETEISGTQKTNEFIETYLPTFFQNLDPPPPAHNHYWNGMEMTTTSQRLKSIVFTGGKVEFNRVADRQDDLGSRLDNIVIYSSPDNATYTRLRSFSFQQGYYYSSLDYSNNAPNGFAQLPRDRYRLRLDRLILKDANGNAISNYQFYYNPLMPPPKTSCAQDWWGYFNGQTQQTMIPTSNFHATFAAFTVGGANRSCDETSMKAGILQKIVYPTGGYTVFETEAHRFNSEGFETDYLQYSAIAMGLEGQVHKQVIDFVGTDLIEDSTHININFSPYSTSGNPSYINADDRAGNAANPIPQVSIKDISSGVITYFTSPDPSQWTSKPGFAYLFLPRKAYEISVLCYNNQQMAQASVSFALPTMGTTTSTNIIGGLRIKNIRNYNMDNSLASQDTYAYGQTENGSGEYTSIANFSSTQELFQTEQEPLVVGGSTMIEDQTTWYSGLIFDQTLLQGSPVAYRYVTKYHGDAANNSGKTVYYYGSDPFFTTAPLPAGLSLLNNMGLVVNSNDWANGQPVSQQEFRKETDGSYTLIQAVTNTYNKQVTDTGFDLLAKVGVWLSPAQIYLYQLSNFLYFDYPIQTGFVQLTQTKKDEYLAGQTTPLTTITNYTYDNTHHDFKAGESYTNSKGELISTTLKYPFNKADLLATGSLTSAQSTAIDNMVTKNMISPVLEETRTRAGAPVSRKRTPYELVNGSTIAPVNVQLQVGTNPIETRLYYTQYDGLGNLVAQQKANDASNTYIWDYQSSYVVAAVNNALQGDVAYTSFEADGTGGWSLASPSRDAGSGITGGRSYVLTNIANEIQRAGLTAATTYVVSYWTTNSSAFNIAGTLSGYPLKGKTVTVNGVPWTYFEHKVSGQSSISITGAGHIDELRLYPANAQMQTFTYSLLTGMTSQCDVSGRISYYEYDALGRLQDVRDQDGNIVKTLEYHYQQP